jgi:hypothetical protein
MEILVIQLKPAAQQQATQSRQVNATRFERSSSPEFYDGKNFFCFVFLFIMAQI